MTTTGGPQRMRMIREIEIRLGGLMIDVELLPEHYNLAIDYAVQRYRQRAGNSMEESFVFLDTVEDVQEYTVPGEIQELIAIYRSSLGGGGTGVAGTVDPFSLAFAQNLYMVGNLGGMGSLQSGSAGFLSTYDFAMQNQKIMGRMFGRDVQYTWNSATKRLQIHRRLGGGETIALHVYNAQPEEVLLNDVYARPWLVQYSIAQSKLMLGEARSLYSSLAGPQGGITLNGDALKNEAVTEIEKLDTELKDGIGPSSGYGFCIG